MDLPHERRAWALAWWLAVILSATVLLTLADAGQEEPVHAKAVTLETADFLVPPAGLATKSITLARTPPKVQVAFFAGLADRGKGTLWSSWGDGCLASNGKYYTSVGDHLGTDANCYVYEFDPATRVLRRVVDVLRAIGHMLGLFGHGKIHSGIHQAADGKLYFTTYWGKPREIDAAFKKGYQGSLLLCYDPNTGKTENLGALVPKQGLPASFFDPARQLLYFHAVYDGDVVVYDIKAHRVKYRAGAGSTAGQRTFFRDAKGNVYFSGDNGKLLGYHPDTNGIFQTNFELPAAQRGKKNNTLRAAVTRPTKAGIVYGMTAGGQLFALDPTRPPGRDAIKDLGPNFGAGEYTAVMVMSPDERYLYYAPGAHGSGTKIGAPVVQYEISSGRRKVLAFLHAPLLRQLKYQIGGTYNLQIDPAGERLYLTFNGAEPGARNSFGRPAVVVVGIPSAERR